MNPKNGECERLITNGIKLRSQAAAVVEELDYVERTATAPDPRRRALIDQLSRHVDRLDEHIEALTNLDGE